MTPPELTGRRLPVTVARMTAVRVPCTKQQARHSLAAFARADRKQV